MNRDSENLNSGIIPNHRGAILFYILLISAFILIASPIITTLELLDLNIATPFGMTLIILIQGGITVGLIALISKNRGYDIRKTLNLQKYSRLLTYIIVCIVVFAIGSVMSQLASFLIEIIPELEPETLIAISEAAKYRDPLSFTVFTLAISLGPGIYEELAFRGVILRGFLSRFGKIKSITIVAVLFAIFHFEPIHILTVFPTGLFLGYIVVRTESIYPAIVGHSFNNFIAVISAAILQAQDNGGNLETITNESYSSPWMIIIMLVIIIAGLTYINRLTDNK